MDILVYAYKLTTSQLRQHNFQMFEDSIAYRVASKLFWTRIKPCFRPHTHTGLERERERLTKRLKDLLFYLKLILRKIRPVLKHSVLWVE